MGSPTKKKQYCYDYPRPAVTVDVVILTVAYDDLKVLLIRRRQEPFRGAWALPGGFVDMDEDLEAAARRELAEETGVTDVPAGQLEQLGAFGDPRRDPRGRTISVAYFVLLAAAALDPRAADDAAEVGWFSVFAPPPLAFDHGLILQTALDRLRAQLDYAPVGRLLLPESFSLAQLQRVHEVILRRKLDPRELRKRLLARGLVREVKAPRPGGLRRKVKLYQFR
jgi:8-oxo-dGTP diphosphatase